LTARPSFNTTSHDSPNASKNLSFGTGMSLAGKIVAFEAETPSHQISVGV
jgi:hypothetical protein